MNYIFWKYCNNFVIQARKTTLWIKCTYILLMFFTFVFSSYFGNDLRIWYHDKLASTENLGQFKCPKRYRNIFYILVANKSFGLPRTTAANFWSRKGGPIDTFFPFSHPEWFWSLDLLLFHESNIYWTSEVASIFIHHLRNKLLVTTCQEGHFYAHALWQANLCNIKRAVFHDYMFFNFYVHQF